MVNFPSLISDLTHQNYNFTNNIEFSARLLNINIIGPKDNTQLSFNKIQLPEVYINFLRQLKISGYCVSSLKFNEQNDLRIPDEFYIEVSTIFPDITEFELFSEGLQYIPKVWEESLKTLYLRRCAIKDINCKKLEFLSCHSCEYLKTIEAPNLIKATIQNCNFISVKNFPIAATSES